MKTVYETQFEKLIISSICTHDCTDDEKAKLLWDFYNHGSTYYEDLCEFLFLLSNGEKECFLFITPAGKPYLSFFPMSANDFFVLLSSELPRFESDLYDQLNFFFEHFPSKENCHNLDTNEVDFGSTLC